MARSDLRPNGKDFAKVNFHVPYTHVASRKFDPGCTMILGAGGGMACMMQAANFLVFYNRMIVSETQDMNTQEHVAWVPNTSVISCH